MVGSVEVSPTLLYLGPASGVPATVHPTSVRPACPRHHLREAFQAKPLSRGSHQLVAGGVFIALVLVEVFLFVKGNP